MPGTSPADQVQAASQQCHSQAEDETRFVNQHLVNDERAINIVTDDKGGARWRGGFRSRPITHATPDVLDSATGQVLRGELVEVSRREEMEYFLFGRFQGKDVYDKVPEAESWERTGRPPIKVR